MLIYVNDANGVVYPADDLVANYVTDVPAGTRITGVCVNGNAEPCDFVADGEPIMIALPAIKRLFGGPRKVA